MQVLGGLRVAMDRESQCLIPVDFESRAFGFLFYRVMRFDEGQLRTELAGVADARPMAADSKVSADDVVASHGLMRLGFRKVCMQITLRHDLTLPPEPPCSEVRIADRLDLEEEAIWAHARNFTRDRFSLDPLLPATGRHRLYYQWFCNSFGGSKHVAYIGPNVCTFSRKGDDIVIDLFSILEQRRGNGSRLTTAVLEHARQSGASSVLVTTECENRAAWSLYQRKGFVPVTYTSVFHLVIMT
jgi:GNAT superfamily N-acetyltransferase